MKKGKKISFQGSADLVIEINNLTRFKIDKKLIERIALIIFQKEKRQKKNISVVFINEKEIKNLNLKYRKNNKATNVLAFVFFDKKAGISREVEKEIGLGEIIIAPEFVKKEAKKLKEDFKKRILRIFIHGLLHLLGYNDEREVDQILMRKKEDYYLAKIF